MLLTLFFIFSITAVSAVDADLSDNNQDLNNRGVNYGMQEINHHQFNNNLNMHSLSKNIFDPLNNYIPKEFRNYTTFESFNNLHKDFRNSDLYGSMNDFIPKEFKNFDILVFLHLKPEKKYGYWVLSEDMHNVNFDELSDNGVNVIFLNSYAFTQYGQRDVLDWVKDANNHGIEVHVWMQIFYTGNWIPPVKDGMPDNQYFNYKIDEARHYASLDGISGIQMDYIRFDGDAYKFKDGTNAVNEFVKNFTKAVKDENPSLTVSATVMPETDNGPYFYGQDTHTMGKYVDVIIPMMYKGNYEENSSWILNTTQWYVNNSGNAEIWVGLQTYRSDDNIQKTPADELIKDGELGFEGNGKGVIYFRYGMNQELDHKKLN